MIPARAWTPASALRDGALTARVAETANAWADRWFAEARRGSVRLSFSGDEPWQGRSCACWEAAQGALLLAVERSAQLEIAGAMLGGVPSSAEPTPTDLRMLERLVAPCLEDFARAAALSFGAPGEARRFAVDRMATTARESRLRFSIRLGAGTAPLNLLLEEHLAITARKGMAPPRRDRAPALARRFDAIAQQPLSIGARVGAGTIALADLRDLAAGDVIVIDRALNEDIEMTVNGRTQPGLRCALQTQGAEIALKLTQTQGVA